MYGIKSGSMHVRRRFGLERLITKASIGSGPKMLGGTSTIPSNNVFLMA